MIDESTFARRSLRAYQLYSELSARETSPALKQLLADLAHTSRDQFDFWARKSGVRGDMTHVPFFELWFFIILRWVCGVGLATKFAIGSKERTIAQYARYCRTCNPDSDVRTVHAFVERMHAIASEIAKV